MTDDRNGTHGLWPSVGQVKVSDTEILLDMINRLNLGEAKELTADLIYTAYLEFKKEADAWIKYYMISVVLLLMTATNAIKELNLFGTKVDPHFIGVVAVLSFSVCTLVYSNHELKMRLYRTFFEGLVAGMNGPDRARILLRYPLAFYGGSYIPYEARPKGFLLGWFDILASLPLIGILGIAWLLAVFGLMALAIYALYGVYVDPNLPLPVKVATSVFFFGSMFASGRMLRDPKIKHRYQTWPLQ